MPGAPLPPGWTGKNWALQQGLAAADPRAAWILTVDADMRLAPLALASALRHATAHGAAMLSVLPRLELGSFWEKVLVPHAGELYTLLVGSMNRVNDARSGTAGANGQFILLRRDVYAAVGEHRAVRGEVAEDWALAHRVKGAGYRLLLADGRAVVRARVYAGLGALWRGFAKTLFPAAGRSVPRVAGVAFLLTTYGCAALVAAGPRPARAAPRADARRPRARGARRVRLALIQLGPHAAAARGRGAYLGLNPCSMR